MPENPLNQSPPVGAENADAPGSSGTIRIDGVTRTIEELCDWIETYADSIYVREKRANGSWGTFALTELPPQAAIHYALDFICRDAGVRRRASRSVGNPSPTEAPASTPSQKSS